MQATATMHTAEELASGAIELMTLPEVYWRVKHVVDDPDATQRDVAKAIVTDPGMTARILRLVNSAHWGMHGRIESVARAVALLGMLHVHDLVLSTSIGVTFRGIRSSRMNVARFRQGSVYRALAASAMARCARLADTERLFVEGLLSDIGHMVMYQKVPELADEALKRAAGNPEVLPQIERELIGCDYAAVGGALAAVWELPECFQVAIAWQNDPEKAGEHALEAALLNAAGRLAEQYLACRESPAGILDSVVLRQAGLTPDQLPSIEEEARASLGAMVNLLAAA